MSGKWMIFLACAVAGACLVAGVSPAQERPAATSPAASPAAATSLPAATDVDLSHARVKMAELSPAAEAAIDKGLAWLAKHQQADGSWVGESWAGGFPVGSTATALMSFMLKGHFPGEKPYSEVMTKGTDYLIKQAKAGDGYMGTNMYEHGLATLALSELWGMTEHDEDVQKSLKAAVKVILRSQSPAGGWRYQPRPADADISVTVLQIVALSSARQAGILVPDKVIQKATDYIRSCRDPQTGGFTYMPYQEVGFGRTAAGAYALMLCGYRDSREVKSALEFLLGQPSSVFTTVGYYYYAHYYAAQVMYQAGDTYYQKWYPQIRDALLARQTKDGSWPPTGDGGSVISTTFSLIILGTPYRFLPIYQK